MAHQNGPANYRLSCLRLQPTTPLEIESHLPLANIYETCRMGLDGTLPVLVAAWVRRVAAVTGRAAPVLSSPGRLLDTLTLEVSMPHNNPTTNSFFEGYFEERLAQIEPGLIRRVNFRMDRASDLDRDDAVQEVRLERVIHFREYEPSPEQTGGPSR